MQGSRSSKARGVQAVALALLVTECNRKWVTPDGRTQEFR